MHVLSAEHIFLWLLSGTKQRNSTDNVQPLIAFAIVTALSEKVTEVKLDKLSDAQILIFCPISF